MEFDLGRFHAGDEALFADLVRTCSPRLLPYLRRYVNVDADAQDLLQEVWLRAFTKRRTYDGRGSFVGWLFMVARTVGMAAVRRRPPAASSMDVNDIADDVDSEAELRLESLRETVLTLPERQRQVVLLRLVEGLSTAETARRLECAEGTVKATLHQATRKLRDLLKESVQ